ncbi:sigma-70 family RNA polymerase sigma factor [Gorillibacterium sp. CAU 1737]|uniref:RNA polymerase sigma factor n=1 Tax=Gorillibacterium sp. CAU 1737 TaxID=3140362 RepID=UPI003260EE58
MSDFGKVYTEHFSDVYKYVFSLSQNETIAEEVTQDTFFKAMKHMDRFNGTCKLSVWLCQIAKNTYFSHYQKQQRFAPALAPEVPGPADVERDYLNRESAKRLHGLVHRLKEPYKEVFMLRVYGELSFRQIGDLFGKTDSWARLIFYRAKKQLQEDLT